MARSDIIDLSESGRQARLLRRRRWARVLLPVMLLVALAIALVFILYVNHQANRRDALALSDTVIRSTADRIETEVISYLTPAQRMVELGRNQMNRYTPETIRTGLRVELGPRADAADTPVDIDGPAPLALQTTGIDVLNTIPQLAMVNIADTQGSFVMPKKMAGGAIDTKIIDRRGEAPTVSWVRRNASGEVQRIEQVAYDGYDPRQRPWYEGAVASDGLFWTDIYILFTDRKPGVTAAHPLRGAEGELLGVLGVDIELDELCSFLAGLKIGRTGRAIIVDDAGRVVAHPDITKTMKQTDGGLSTVTVEELGEPALTRAYNRFRVRGDGTYALELDGVNYRASASTLPESLGTDWHVLITVPEDDYVGFVNERTRATATLSAALLGALGLFAGVVLVYSLRSDRRALSVLDRQAEFDRVSEAYLALSSDAGLLDKRDDQAIQRLTETAAQATGVMRVSVWRLASDQLECLDAFDRLGQGHVSGMALDLRTMPRFVERLNRLELTAAGDVSDEPGLSELDELYLDPLHHDSVVVTPTIQAGRPTGVLMLEGSRLETGWSNVVLSFARSLSTLLGVRFGADGTPRGQAEPMTTTNAAPEQAAETRAAPPPPKTARDAPKTFDRSRITAFEVQTVADAGVLVILSTTQRPTMRLGDDDPLAAGLLHEMACLADDWAADRQGVRVCRAGDRLVVATGLVTDPTQATDESIADLARLALDLQTMTRQSDKEDQIAVRMGIDVGEAGLAHMGRDSTPVQVVGPAPRIATQLAECCSGDTIQVSDRAYERLRGRFLLQRRGGFYAHGVGQIGLFYLGGELEEAR